MPRTARPIGRMTFSNSLPGDVKKVITMSEPRGTISEHFRLNAMTPKMYSDVKQAIINYFRSRQTCQVSGSNGTAPMEMDAFRKTDKGNIGKGTDEGDKGKG